MLASLLPGFAKTGKACSQPDRWSVATAFDLASNSLLPAPYPQLPVESTVHAIPPSLLKAVGWVESGWRQLTPTGRPLVSFDFGYGIMQITSGMAGAYGDVTGDVDAETQSQIASDYIYNIAYGARMLVKKWASVPQVGNGDPAVVENWYYALWAYNGWGWANNPNNPRFKRNGTPATDPTSYPYQERVLYLVAHPPRDVDGNPLWRPVAVTLPPRRIIKRSPGPLTLTQAHRQSPPPFSPLYHPAALPTFSPGSTRMVPVHLVNTGTRPWLPSRTSAVSLGYHLLTLDANPWHPFSPFTQGVVAFGQGAASLNRLVAPGQGTTVRVPVTAPTAPGTYRLVWDLHRQDADWSSEAGGPVMAQRLMVRRRGVSPAASPTPGSTPTAVPSEDLRFVADTSIPDGSSLLVHQQFLKGWLVFNSGKLGWPAGSSLRLVSGASFGAGRIELPAAGPCRSVNLVTPLQAPNKPGQFRSVWQPQDANGRSFGERLTVVVSVRKASPAGTPLPTPAHTPSPTPVRPTATPVATPTPVG